MHILLVDDNEGDIELIDIAFKRAKTEVQLSVAHDGIEALEFLTKNDAHKADERPDLVLIDLNMPRMGGREFLQAVKNNEELRTIPIIILTSSTAPTDVNDCYHHHANCYIMKPFEFDKMVLVAQQIAFFWGQLVRLPLKDDLAVA
jgi:CheY-like chemotaxis protein